MATLTIKVAPQGAGFGDNKVSAAGHVWYELTDDNGNRYSYGFNSKKVSTTDNIDYSNNGYLGKIYEKKIDIANNEFKEMKKFGDYYSGNSKEKPNLDFNLKYNLYNNSCISFTWRALESAGLNPNGFKGNKTPIENINNFEKIGDMISEGHRGDNLSGYEKDGLYMGTIEALSALGFAVNGIVAFLFNGLNLNTSDPFPLCPVDINKTCPLDDFSKPFINPIIYDPLVLDLNGDGIKIIPEKDGVYFDHNNDGISFKTSWINPDDGILVLDKNSNNTVDNGSELFGNFSEILDEKENKILAKNGFEALKFYDKNNDGLINSGDEIYNLLKIWQDKNSNGISEKDELKSLKDLKITEINLKNITNINQKIQDSILTLQSDFKIENNQNNHKIYDVNFSINSFNRVFKDSDKILSKLTQEQQKIPNILASGFVRNLKEALYFSDNLTNLLTIYTKANTKTEQIKILDNLIYEWAKTAKNFDDKNFEILKASENQISSNLYIQRMTPTQYKLYKDFTITDEIKSEFKTLSSKLAIINSFLAKTSTKFYITSIDDFSKLKDGINFTYENIKKYTYKTLLISTRLKEYIENITLDFTENKDNKGQISFNLSPNFNQTISKFKQINQTNPQKAFVDLCEFVEIYGKDKALVSPLISLLSKLSQTAKENGVLNEYLSLLNKETIKNLSIQHGSENDDILIGTGILNGIDTLIAKDGNDILIGGDGDDYLQGDNGDDIYEFSQNFGKDIINNFHTNKSDKDIIKFSDNTTKDELNFAKHNDDLIINKILQNSINGSNIDNSNQIIIKDFFKDDTNLSYTFSEINFANSDKISSEQIVENLLKPTTKSDNLDMFYANKDYEIYALDGDDIIHTKNGDDIIYGGKGDDNIYAGNGDDYINGGEGDDYLQGGEGNDIYEFNSKFGNDEVINFKPNQSQKDTLKFSDLNAKELEFKRGFKDNNFSNDLLINTKNGIVKIIDFFDQDSINKSYLIDEIITKDKTLNLEDIINKLSQTSNLNDAIFALNQDDIHASKGNDILKANSKGSRLYADKGDDVLISNIADDILNGGKGDDKYIYHKNGGNDVIEDNGGDDTLLIKGYDKDDAKFSIKDRDLIINFNNSNDKITIKNHYRWLFGKPNQIENIIFDKDDKIAIANVDKFIQNSKIKDDFKTKIFENETLNFNKITHNLTSRFAGKKATNFNKDSNFINQTQINKIIEQLNTYANDNGLTSITHDDIASNQNLMQLVMSGWGN